MSKILGIIFFINVMIGIYFSMHIYVFFKLSYLFNFKKDFLFYIVILFLVISMPLFSIIERKYGGIIARGFYIATMIWLGTIFLLLTTMIIYDLISLFIKINKLHAGYAIIIIVFLLLIYRLINAYFITIKEVVIPLNNIDKEIKIVQLSDIHIGTIHGKNYLKKIIEKTNNLNPDFILITGDLIDGSGKINFDDLTPIKDFNAKIFFSTGNHEIYEGINNVMTLINRTKITPLQNKMINYKGVQIIGINNPDSLIGKSNSTLNKFIIDSSKPSILMYHIPVNLEKANLKGINLQLSGHTHNGQIFPFNLIVKLFFHRINGLYKYKESYLYVSPGTGTWGPPLRIGSQSEITLLRLIPK